jgi:membrane-associated phospholipid phosphatase
MPSPLDTHAANRIGAVRAARLFSNIVSPPVMFALLGLAIALRELPFWPALAWASVYGFFVSLAPILVVLYLLRSGRIAELHMSNTSERHLPYLSAFAFAALTFALVTLYRGPELMRCLALFNALELAALGLINVAWLISIHATGVMATMLIVGLVFGWPYALLVLPFVVAICWVRLYLKRHSPGQVLAGLGLGVLSVFSLTLFGCFTG